MSSESFPRQQARTRRFTLGAPRSISVAADGSRVAFLRSPAGDDPVTALWALDLDDPRERLVADAARWSRGGDYLPDAERARRERARETAEGITAYATDPALSVAAFTLAGRVVTARLDDPPPGTGTGGTLGYAQPAFDPRPDPTGRRVAYVSDRALRVCALADDEDVLIAGEDDPDVSWGLAEFVAAEEMGRFRGFWWAPDGQALLAARVDTRPVQRWHIADPADPSRPPAEIAYPAAGTADALVSLAILGLDGRRVDVDWDRDAFPYLVEASWPRHAQPTVLVMSRDQRRLEVRTVDPVTGATACVYADRDPRWLDVVPGVPAWTDDGRLVVTADRDGTRRLLVDGEPVTPPGLQVRAVVDVGADVLFTASTEPTEVHLHSLARGPLTEGRGVHAASAGGRTLVLTTADLDSDRPRTVVHRDGAPVATLTSCAEVPALTVRPALLAVGERRLRSALLLPTGWDGREPLPVLLDPYGGPHAQRVLATRGAYRESQWFADQGFAVLVADGRGTPGRGPDWDRAVHRDLATPVLDDQVDALHAVAAEHPELDLSRVAIRGWSFGGYLAALAVLRRPAVFHAAIAGAPVTDWRLYDTFYTERYLGHPGEDTAPYDACSLLADAHLLRRPLMLIHGLADDNVVAAHTLQLSSALLAAGRPHTVLPLSGVTHMTPQEVVAENLLLLQVAFLRDALSPGGAR